MERVMAAFKIGDINYIYVVIGVVVILAILCLAWVMFQKKGMRLSADEVTNAELALSEAKHSEADLYAQDEYQKAEESLARATYLMAGADNRNARQALKEAVAYAHQADKAVDENKAKMKAEDERMLNDFNRQVDELKTRVAKTGSDTPVKVPREVQELVGKWEIMKMRIPDLIQREKIREAYDELKTIAVALNIAQRQDFIAKSGAVK